MFRELCNRPFYRIAEDTGSGLCYADYYKNIAGKEEKHPVIDYLSGSIRDDFDFGTILFYRNRSIREAAGTDERDIPLCGMV